METKDPNKPVVASPFKIRDSKQPISPMDIQYLVEQNNYTNKYLQTLGTYILRDISQVGESFSTKTLEKPLFKPYEILLKNKRP